MTKKIFCISMILTLTGFGIASGDDDLDIVVTSLDASLVYNVQGSPDLVTWSNVSTGDLGEKRIEKVRTDYPDLRYFRVWVPEIAEGQPIPVIFMEDSDGTIIVYPPDPEEGGGGEVVSLLQDFSNVPGPWQGPFTYWAWSAEQREIAGERSNREIIFDDILESDVLKVKYETGMPGIRLGVAEVVPLTDYIPPEADTVRIKIRMMGGQVILGFGGITVALGNANAYTDFKSLSGEDESWRVIDFSLLDDVSRNHYRRGRLTGAAPMVYLPRYLQEQLFLYVSSQSRGTVLIDDIEFINKGRGRSYPDFDEKDVVITAPIADFEEWNEEQVFSLSMGEIDLMGPEPTNFQRSSPFSTPYVEVGDKIIAWWPEPELEQVDVTDVEGNPTGNKAMGLNMQGLESVIWGGVQTETPPEGTNAVEFLIKAEHDRRDAGAPLVVDFTLLAAPESHRPFDWDLIHHPDTWTDIGTYFDYYPTAVGREQLSYSFYHTRHALPNREWVRVRLPFVDFTCGYSQGEEPEVWRQEQRYLDAENIVAVAFQSGWQQLQSITRFQVDEVNFVSIEADSDEDLQSYWRIPANTNISYEIEDLVESVNVFFEIYQQKFD